MSREDDMLVGVLRSFLLGTEEAERSFWMSFCPPRETPPPPPTPPLGDL